MRFGEAFGDKDPEDAYDAGDEPEVRLGVLERVVVDLEDGEDDGRRRARRDDAIRVLRILARERDVDRRRLEELRARLEELD